MNGSAQKLPGWDAQFEARLLTVEMMMIKPRGASAAVSMHLNNMCCVDASEHRQMVKNAGSRPGFR
jgi:hypothetical protein